MDITASEKGGVYGWSLKFRKISFHSVRTHDTAKYLATKIYQSFPRCKAEHLVNYFVDGDTFEIVLNLLNELLSYNDLNLIKRLEKIINVDVVELTYNRIYEIIKDLSRVFILAFGDEEKNKVLIHENCCISIQEITNYTEYYVSFEPVIQALLYLGYYPYRYSKSSRPKEELSLELTYYPKYSYNPAYSGLTIVNILKLNPDENTNTSILASTSIV